ncbi:MAG: helix-turn-helix transcriptional regulator [Oscillospiraceae bacterium]|nr:helix-turn-helix transcriptional regulator [Oscillospiraceae bacterium]
MKRLKELRIENGYTQLQMQMKTGIDQSDYSKIERGSRELTLKQAIIIAKLFNTSIDYLVELTDEKAPYPSNKN